MNDLAIAYHEWFQQITNDNNEHKFVRGKGIDHIRTKGGQIYDVEEWKRVAFEWVKVHKLLDLYKNVITYVIDNCGWLTFDEIEQYALDCMLHESYKKWDDFVQINFCQDKRFDENRAD